MINTPGNGRKCRHQGSVSSDRVGLFDSTDMLFCSDATANELLNEIQKTDHLNFYSSENSNLGNAADMAKCEKSRDLLHLDVIDVKQSRKFYEKQPHQSLVKLNNVISNEKGPSFSGDDEVHGCAVVLPRDPSENGYAAEHPSGVVGYTSNGYCKGVDVDDYGCSFDQRADISEHYGYSARNDLKKEVWHHQQEFDEPADHPGFASDISELECSSSVDFGHHGSLPYGVDYSIADPTAVYGGVCSGGGVEDGDCDFVDGNAGYADGGDHDGRSSAIDDQQQRMFVSMVDGEEVNEGFASPNDNNNHSNGTLLCTKKGPTTKTCEYCGLFLRYPSKIAAHMRTHTGERPFQCEICGQCFSQRTPYRMHLKRHVGDLPHSCSFCTKKFPNKASRNGHELKVHYGLKRVGFPQPHLKRSASSVGKRTTVDQPALRSPIVNWQSPVDELRKPLSDNTLRKITNTVQTVETGGDSDVFSLSTKRLEDRHPPTVAQCAECGLIFKHPSKIQAHMRTHTGEKPFVCRECGLGCSTNSALRVHVRRFHTGDRPHLCTWDCGRRFVSVAARNEHERIVHAGIKRYQCTFGDCRRLFTRRSYMVKHLQAHYSAEGINLNRAATSSVKRNGGCYNHKQTHNVGAESFLDEAVNNSRIFNHYQNASAQHHNNHNNQLSCQKNISGNNLNTISLLDKMFVKQHPLAALSPYTDGDDSVHGTVGDHSVSLYYEKTTARSVVDEETEMSDELSEQLLMNNTDYEEEDDDDVI